MHAAKRLYALRSQSLVHVQATILRDWSCGKNEASGRAPLAAACAPNVTTVEHNVAWKSAANVFK
jgi:hypothetical protein